MNNPEKQNTEQEPQGVKEFDLNYLSYLQELGRPITRKDVEDHVIVVQPEEFKAIDHFDIINSQGELITVDLKNNQSEIPLIIRPEELADEK